MRRWRRMCLRALCTILETESLEIGTVAAGSVSFDKAELMSLFSAGEKNYTLIKQLPSNILYCINYVFVSLRDHQHLELWR